MDRLILPQRGGPRLVKNADGTISVVGEGVRQEPMTKITIDRIGEPGKLTRVSPEDTLLAIARMQRDGRSLKQIREYLDLMPGITDAVLQGAIDNGHELLRQRIAEGAEPEESVVVGEVPTAMWEEGDLPVDENGNILLDDSWSRGAP